MQATDQLRASLLPAVVWRCLSALLQLLVRRFTAAGESKGRKQLPKVWYDKRTPASQLQAGYMAAMTEPLFPDPNANIVFPTYYGSF